MPRLGQVQARGRARGRGRGSLKQPQALHRSVAAVATAPHNGE